jgi:hypothetical protein
MTQLERNALATVPLSRETVESFYDGSRSGTAEQCLRAPCASHERLRAEIDGMDALLKDDNAEVLRLRDRLDKVLALTDTGSAEFLAAFPPDSQRDVNEPRETVPGWRVVEKLREVLLG